MLAASLSQVNLRWFLHSFSLDGCTQVMKSSRVCDPSAPVRQSMLGVLCSLPYKEPLVARFLASLMILPAALTPALAAHKDRHAQQVSMRKLSTTLNNVWQLPGSIRSAGSQGARALRIAARLHI